MYYLCHYLLPSGCISNLNVPSFQLCEDDVFSTFKAICLALARVSTFVVDDVTVKGPSEELDLALFGKSYIQSLQPNTGIVNTDAFNNMNLANMTVEELNEIAGGP